MLRQVMLRPTVGMRSIVVRGEAHTIFDACASLALVLPVVEQA